VNDEERIERLLRARPATDPAYQPSIADILEVPSDRQSVVGTLRWRHGGLGRTRPVTLILVGAAILLTAVGMVMGSQPTKELVVVPPMVTTATPEPVPEFPAAALTDLLSRFETSGWPARPDVVIEAGVVREGRIWVTASGLSASTSIMGDSRPDTGAVRVGSLTHLRFVAIALSLVDQGRLELDSPISRYVPNWPGGDAITVRNLLDASSGVASFGEPIEALAGVVAAEPSRTWTAADALRLARDKAPRFRPGASHEHVDTEDALLVDVIEAVTGAPVENAYFELVQHIGIPMPVDRPGPPALDAEFRHGPGYWDPNGSGTLVEVADLPDDVLAVLGPALDWAIPVGPLAQLTDHIHGYPRLLSDGARVSLDKPFEDGGFGGSAMCPCTGDAKNGVGLIGHTGPYTSLAVYVPSERLTIAIEANVAISDDELERQLQEIHDLVWPAIR
jgi:CubicO group peptidase (beta-lactamase class C family)